MEMYYKMKMNLLKILLPLLMVIMALTHYSCSPKISSNMKLKKDSAVFQFAITTKDFGLMREGYEAVQIFEFVNIGNAPLIIENVETECSCTISEFSKQPVIPNTKGFVKVIYKSAGNSGSMNKSITIFSNATEKEKKLFIKGKVISVGRR
ncbi:MAG: hypothetical protein RL708_172 [Bacteroidota bacterium]